MMAPNFWWQRKGLSAALLWPLSLVYGAVAARRMDKPGQRPPLPVVCVGNFVAGGAGKTPTAIALAQIARRHGLEPCFLTRGYGGRRAGPLRVDPERHHASEVGDEALLLAAVAPTIVSRRRTDAFPLLQELGASICFMDDGLQNPTIAKSFSMAVVDGAVGVGNGLTIPAGPLRAPLARQAAHVDALVIYGDGARSRPVVRMAARSGKLILRARLRPDRPPLPPGTRVFAFTGIGRPEKFYRSLEEVGMEIASYRSFSDHHAFTGTEALEILRDAAALSAVPVTTEKDAVRLRHQSGPLAELAEKLSVFTISAGFDDPFAIGQMLLAARARWLRQTY